MRCDAAFTPQELFVFLNGRLLHARLRELNTFASPQGLPLLARMTA